MFQCAWCKKEEIDPCAWSEYKEPICSQCEYKYRIAKEQKMFTGKVADLTKEQRREISTYINSVSSFVVVMRSIKKEKLVGRTKLVSNVLGWTLLALLFIPLVAIDSFQSWLGSVYFYVYVVTALIVFNQVNWWLKLFQLKKKAKKLGFNI